MPEALRLRMIAGEEDILTPMAATRKWQTTSNPCTECGGAIQQTMDTSNTFDDGDPLPRTVGKCVDCGFTFEPRTGLVVSTSKPWEVEEVLPIIKPSKDD